MTREFEVMVFQIGNAMRHVFLASLNRLLPERRAVALDADLASDRSKLRADNQLRPDAALAELGACKVQIVASFKAVIREFITRAHANAVRCAIVCDEVDPGD